LLRELKISIDAIERRTIRTIFQLQWLRVLVQVSHMVVLFSDSIVIRLCCGERRHVLPDRREPAGAGRSERHFLHAHADGEPATVHHPERAAALLRRSIGWGR
jgi:hypothetical protein